MTTDPRDRLYDLLAADATQGLMEDELRELSGLLTRFPDEHPDSFAHAAAAVDLALTDPPEPLPPELAAIVEQQATAYFTAMNELAPPPRSSRYAHLGWAVAAGLAAILLWTLWPTTKDPAALYDRLRNDSNTLTFAGEKGGAKGDAVWNALKQEGYVKVSGLPPLDPSRERYQLWIVDSTREGSPVDGGLFDVKPDGTAVVPVKAALKIKEAQTFMITKEAADGVVVTKGPVLVSIEMKR